MKRLFASLFLTLALFAFVAPAHAQLRANVFTRLSDQYFSSSYETGGASLEDRLPIAVGSIISIFLSLIGVVLLVIVVYAGYLWLTAGGNEEQVTHAKQLIKNAVIGMTIALGAFVITQFVVGALTNALGSGSVGGPPPDGPVTPNTGSGPGQGR